MKKKDLYFFIAASAFIGISQSIDSSVFNNFLNDTFHVTVSQRTILEFPREFPGFMVVFISGILLFLGDVRIASVANVIAAFGLMGLGFLSRDFGVMMIWMLIYSTGTHLFMPVSNSIGMNLASDGNIGKVLGRINGVNTAAFLVTSLTTALIFRYVKVSYKPAFLVAAAAYLVSAVLIFNMTPKRNKTIERKILFKKEYSLFYWLNITNGARKQVFLTFGPWVLIKIFNQGVSTFAVIGFAVAGIGIFFKPFVGVLIDRKGERFVLAAEALLLVIVCGGYIFAEGLEKALFVKGIALYLSSACFVVDQLLNAASMARATYMRKIALSPEDVSPTLSMGISLDHAVSMVVPWLGSFIWNAFGYEYVFIGGACIACVNLILTRGIKTTSGSI